jgi:hypothetical protein
VRPRAGVARQPLDGAVQGRRQPVEHGSQPVHPVPRLAGHAERGIDVGQLVTGAAGQRAAQLQPADVGVRGDRVEQVRQDRALPGDRRRHRRQPGPGIGRRAHR